MARDLQQLAGIEHMATRMNMLKLLQEVRGFAQFPAQPQQPRPGPLLLQFHGPVRRKNPSKAKHLLRIDMQEPLDIPQSVPIRFVSDTGPAKG